MTQKIHSNFSIPAWKMPFLVFGWSLYRYRIAILLVIFAVGTTLFVFRWKGYITNKDLFVFVSALFIVGLIFFAVYNRIFYRKILLKYLAYSEDYYRQKCREIANLFDGDNTYEEMYKARHKFYSNQLTAIELRGKKTPVIGYHPIRSKEDIHLGI